MDFLDHNDPRQRLLYNDEPKDWNPVKEPIPLSMRANTKDIYLADDDTKYGPPGNRKPGVVEYEARKMMEGIGNGWSVTRATPWRGTNSSPQVPHSIPEYDTMYAETSEKPKDLIELLEGGAPRGNKEWTSFSEELQDNALDWGASTVNAIETHIPGYADHKRELEIKSKREACEMTPPQFRERCNKQLKEMENNFKINK